MKIKKIRLVSFSPTGNSRKVITAIAAAFPDAQTEDIDITQPGNSPTIQCRSDELVLFGAPVYAGRIAPLAVERLKNIRGISTPAVVMVTYGNREYEDALAELQDLAEDAGFTTIAAASFIGEHSYSTAVTPIAPGRPDSSDLATAEEFGRQIRDRLEAAADSAEARLQQLPPGNRPYQKGLGPLPFAPSLLESRCTQCESCLPVCPAAAISLAEQIEIDRDLCILCCACVKICPEEALVMDAPPLVEKTQWLYDNCSTRKEPELYL
ncbi:MAG: EFR1 family ferrodoxin [Desulfopila sp.]|nr:EFR1 family ferrodoxin [Desulfopila sp.]